MDPPLYPSENAQMDASGLIPSSCVSDMHFSEFSLVEAYMVFCRYPYDNATGNLDHTRKTSM